MNARRTLPLAPLAIGLLLLGASFATPASGQELSVRFGTNVCSTETRPTFQASGPYAHRRPAVRATTYAPRARYAPRAYGHARVWVPGRYEVVLHRVWVPGGVRRVYEEPRYELRTDSCGNSVRVLVRHGGWRTTHVPGCYETKRVRVWRPGHWA